jgi:hypothetical protein
MKLLNTIILVFVVHIAISQNLIKIQNHSNRINTELFSNESIKIHYFENSFSIAIAPEGFNKIENTVIFSNAWDSSNEYFLVGLPSDNRNEYLTFLKENVKRILVEEKHAFIEIEKNKLFNLYPAIHGGLIRISPEKAELAKTGNISKRSIELDAKIVEAIGKVDIDAIEASIQHLQDYGTRKYSKPEAFEAQEWLMQQYETMGLQVETQDFPVLFGSSSDNVIAIIPGQISPDEFVICGAHYDSFSSTDLAPGADDNASGTAGILEIARILKDYNFNKSIVFCSFSAEEIGLFGSHAYASRAKNNQQDILGYFNMDMISYRNGNDPIGTTIVAPSSADELATFYTDVCALYLPDFIIERGDLETGNSDHASFNNNGYQGIFPFEDVLHYSPYIHTKDDILGLSANSMIMAEVFTQATLASVASMAEIIDITGESEYAKNDVSVYPNPATNKIYITGVNNKSEISYTIRNTSNQIVANGTVKESIINTSNLVSGFYFIQLKYDNIMKVIKVVIA